jgi:hypothetical protein
MVDARSRAKKPLPPQKIYSNESLLTLEIFNLSLLGHIAYRRCFESYAGVEGGGDDDVVMVVMRFSIILNTQRK